MPDDIQSFIDRDDVFDIDDIEFQDRIDRMTCGWPPAEPSVEYGWDEIPF
jgi:hypothetical protein